MTGEKGAPAEMPGVEEIARVIDGYAFKSWQQAHDYEMKTTGDAEEAVKFADWSAGKRVSEARDKARAILALFPSILAEREREIGALQRAHAHELEVAQSHTLAAEAALAAERAESERLQATIRKAHIAMTLACALPGVAGEYDFSEAIATTEAALARRAAAIRAQGE